MHLTHWFDFQSDARWRHLALVLLVAALYVLVFFPLYSIRGIGILAMSAAPVIVAGWYFGLRAGMIAGLLIFPLNTMLMNATGEPGWDVVFRYGGGTGSVAAIVVGAIVGRLHDLGEQLKHELIEYRKVETALQASEERFRMVTEASLAGVYIIQDGKFLYVNPILAQTFGYSPEEMIGRMGPLDVTHPDERAYVVGTMQARLSGEVEAAQYSFTGLRKNGAFVPCEVLGRRVDYLGQPAIVGTLLDNTERKRAQEELLKAERLQAELEKEKEVSELKARFVSMISHEFRNPLAVISSSARMLQQYRDHLKEEQQHAHLGHIQDSVTRLIELLDDTLTISKAETVGLDYQPTMLDIAQLCYELVEEARLTCAATHAISLSCSGDCRPLMADPKLLRQAIMNLLSNAIKYSPEGGPIQVSLDCGSDETRISIQDAGIGIPEDDQKHLFETYHRANNVGHTPGTGLGLAIVRQSMEAHGGSVSCKSQVGQGTTFTVLLPVQECAATPCKSA